MNEIIGKQGIIDSIKFFCMSMEIRDMNPVGLMLLVFLRSHVEPLYNYIMKGRSTEDSAGVYLSKEIDKYCHCGYNLFWGDLLNHCMVDYDIIYILKNYVGYSLWSNVPHKQKHSVTIHSTTSSTFQTGKSKKRNFERHFQNWKITCIRVKLGSCQYTH
jgi:hypothetical protein